VLCYVDILRGRDELNVMFRKGIVLLGVAKRRWVRCLYPVVFVCGVQGKTWRMGNKEAFARLSDISTYRFLLSQCVGFVQSARAMKRHGEICTILKVFVNRARKDFAKRNRGACRVVESVAEGVHARGDSRRREKMRWDGMRKRVSDFESCCAMQ
jgi:hypothetical protein